MKQQKLLSDSGHNRTYKEGGHQSHNVASRKKNLFTFLRILRKIYSFLARFYG